MSCSPEASIAPSRSFDPPTSRQAWSGTSSIASGASGGAPGPPAASRARSSTSKIQRVRNGRSSAAARLRDARKSFAPHCVSYTGSRSARDAIVANTRPR